jgi:uridylate kinase
LGQEKVAKKQTASVYVVKLSGSIFISPELPKILRTISSGVSPNRDLSLFLVAGGGPTARRFIEAGKQLGGDQSTLDEVGIAVSRLNATIVAQTLGDVAFPRIPRSLSEAMDATTIEKVDPKQRIVVCGGFNPGQSTNAVAALLAEKSGASQFINATDVDGVYDRDPNQFKNAKRLSTVSVEQFRTIIGGKSQMAGMYDLMDSVALGIISRSKIPTLIVKCNSNNLQRVLQGKKNRGTRITF